MGRQDFNRKCGEVVVGNWEIGREKGGENNIKIKQMGLDNEDTEGLETVDTGTG
jgi:hypothetical protein